LLCLASATLLVGINIGAKGNLWGKERDFDNSARGGIDEILRLSCQNRTKSEVVRL